MVTRHFHFNGFSPNMLYFFLFFLIFLRRLYLVTPTFIIEPKIKTSPCYKIGVFTESRWSALKYSETKENTLTEASLNINFPFKYIRLVVVDKNNNRLFTRAYFKEELE